MNEESKGFKTSLMGGFNREDVLQYIEQAAKESSERIEALQQQADQLAQEHEELRGKNVALNQKNADLLERLGEITMADEKLQKSADARERQAQDDAETLRQLREQVAALESERSALQTQVETLGAQCANYDATKNNLTDMELSAHRRAKEVEERAQFEAKRVRVQSAEVVSALKKEMTAVFEAYCSAAAQEKHVAAENERRTAELQEKLRRVVSSLDEVIVGELSAEEENAQERPRMQQVLDILRGKEGE